MSMSDSSTVWKLVLLNGRARVSSPTGESGVGREALLLLLRVCAPSANAVDSALVFLRIAGDVPAWASVFGDDDEAEGTEKEKELEGACPLPLRSEAEGVRAGMEWRAGLEAIFCDRGAGVLGTDEAGDACL